MEAKGWIAASWVAASFVTLAGLAIGALVCPKPVPPAVNIAFVSSAIPDCSKGTDYIHGDIAIPQNGVTPADVSRVVCPGDYLFWHDEAKRTLKADFGSSTDCTRATTYTSAAAGTGPETFIQTQAKQVGKTVDCTYIFTVGTTPPLAPAHIIIMK
jgi:hypothetical protein